MHELLRDHLLSLALAALLFGALALAVKGRRAPADLRRAWPEARTNLALFALDLMLVVPALLLLDAALLRPLRETVGAGAWMEAAALPAPAVALLAVFSGDFIAYWRHRLEHCRWLWPAHAVHHSDRAMSWLTLLRFHPLNRFTTWLVDGALLALLGFPLWALVVNALVRHWYGYFIHADLGWTFGPLGRLLVSPAMHKWHHARDPRLAGCNFATVFSLFDQAFGTFHLPGRADVPTGVEDPVGEGAGAQLAYALRPSAYSRRSG